MDTIIVATDLSERSDRTVDRALSLAETTGATCHVVSVTDDALPMALADQMSEAVEEHIRKALQGRNDRIKTEVTILRGDVAEMLIRYAMLHDADLIVLGLHRRRMLLDTLRETTMTRIVAASQTPVLLVKNDVSSDYTNALVPVSFSPSCAGAVLSTKQVAPAAKITSFHALKRVTDEEGAQEVNAAWMEENNLTGIINAPEIIVGGLRKTLKQKLKEDTPDLLAIGAHTRSGIALQKLGSFAADLVRDPPVDLLISHPIDE